jgi:hypothetical protein
MDSTARAGDWRAKYVDECGAVSVAAAVVLRSRQRSGPAVERYAGPYLLRRIISAVATLGVASALQAEGTELFPSAAARLVEGEPAFVAPFWRAYNTVNPAVF